MNTALLAATATQQQFLDELGRHAGEFVLGERLGSLWEPPVGPDSHGFVLALGERDGGAFLFDSSYVLSDAADMLVAMSDRLGLVVGGIAQATTGTYTLTAARDGELLRLVFVQHSGMTEGLAIGEALPTEAEHPIADGDGLFAAFASFGLEASAWLDEGPAYGLRYTFARFPEPGRLAGIKQAHYAEHAR
jgi:hypothetical protein